MERPWERASEEQIQRFERRWKLRLPDDFRRFCLEQNGGFPAMENEFYPVPKIFAEYWEEYGTGVGIDIFYPVRDEQQKPSIGHTMELLKFSEQLEPNRVPIAGDGCGNYIMLSVGGSDEGRLFFRDHELQREFVIANEFGELLDSLTVFPEEV